jgi:hypothetical protein
MEYQKSVNRVPVKERLRDAQTVSEFLSIAKTIATPIGHYGVSPDGKRLFFPGELGQVLVRESDGGWTTRDTGTVQPVTALAGDSGRLIAGSESGVLRVSDDEGRTWHIVASVPAAAIIDVDRAGDRWMVVAASGPWKFPGSRTTHELTVHTASRDDFSDLRQVGRFPVDDITSNVWYGSGAFAKARNAYLLNAPPDMHRLDLSTMQWKKLALPAPISHLFVDPVTGFASAYRVQGIFSKLFVSADAGDSWKELDTPPYTIDVLTFASPTEGHATRWSAGAFTATVEVQDYDAGANRWIKKSELPAGCRKTLWTPGGQVAFCVLRDGSIVRRSGESWVKDR